MFLFRIKRLSKFLYRFLRDMSLSFVKTVVGNQAYRIHLTQMQGVCVNSARTAKDRNFTTTNPLANTALSQSERAYYLS